MKQVHPIVTQVMQRKAEYELKFGNGHSYDEEMQYVYSRTVRDVESLGTSRKLRIIEFGCFTGIVAASLRLLGHHVTGSDIPFVLADEQNAAFLASEGVTLWPHDLADAPLDLPSASYDLIIFNEVLEHLNFNPIPLISEFSRVLVPGGRVYCATPNLASAKNRWLMLRGRSYINPVQHLVSNLIPNTGMSVGLHWREWTKDELIELFETAGFRIEFHRFGLITPNRSGPLRRFLVSLMYRLDPSLLTNQVGVFRKD
jgi:2-polyprenyl-3-methyl-5-hydroxy-6-metoxy-1,4-benzoquinol methylase